jgi:putative autotransporter adhesin-like protein
MTKAIIFLTKLIIVVLLSLLFVSCRYNINIGDGVEGSGNVKTESRNIGSFHGVDAGGGLAVIVEQGDAVSIKVEADDNIIPLIQTEVRNGILFISTEGSYSTEHGPTITVRMPDITKLSIDGGASMRCSGTLISPNLKLNSDGGAQMELEIEADQLSMDASGGAAITVSGKALDVDVNASGGSPVHAAQLQANNVKADASGGASISVYPIVNLDAEASGGGSVSYHKIPKTISKSESGGGSVSEQ